MLFFEPETFLLDVVLEPLYLISDLLSSRLAGGRNPSVDRRTHHSPPPSSGSPPAAPEPPTETGVDMPAPSDERRLCEPPSCDEWFGFVSRSPPRLAPWREGYPRLVRLSFRRLWRVKQNLSFVISPSTTTLEPGESTVPSKNSTQCCASTCGFA